jgi:hypothetical protein
VALKASSALPLSFGLILNLLNGSFKTIFSGLVSTMTLNVLAAIT